MLLNLELLKKAGLEIRVVGQKILWRHLRDTNRVERLGNLHGLLISEHYAFAVYWRW